MAQTHSCRQLLTWPVPDVSDSWLNPAAPLLLLLLLLLLWVGYPSASSAPFKRFSSS
jgi:hypothetical protein